jgi:RNA polymerase sigma-70 factor (ECF subfamily)
MPQDVRNDIVALLPRLFRFAQALTGSKQEAEDVVQTACERALTRLDQFTPGTRLDSWMFRIVRTVAIDRGRLERRSVAVDPVILGEQIVEDPRIAEGTAARQDLDIIREALEELPEQQRSILIMVALEGMSYQEVADSLEIPIGTVMSRLSRARRKLAEAVEAGPKGVER